MRYGLVYVAVCPCHVTVSVACAVEQLVVAVQDQLAMPEGSAVVLPFNASAVLAFPEQGYTTAMWVMVAPGWVWMRTRPASMVRNVTKRRGDTVAGGAVAGTGVGPGVNVGAMVAVAGRVAVADRAVVATDGAAPQDASSNTRQNMRKRMARSFREIGEALASSVPARIDTDVLE